MAQVPKAAVVRENATVKFPVSPGAKVRLAGVTVTVNPGTEADALYVPVVLPTFLTWRVTVCEPGRLPMAIEAWLRFEAEIGVSVSFGNAKCTPRLTMYWRYSVALVE